MGKKERIFEYIRQEVSLRGLPPTIREIGERFDISSTNGVRYFLNRLESEGLIKRQSRTARGIEIGGRSLWFMWGWARAFSEGWALELGLYGGPGGSRQLFGCTGPDAGQVLLQVGSRFAPGGEGAGGWFA